MSHATSDRVIDDLRRVVDDAEALMRETASVAGDGAHEARLRVSESLRQARERLQSLEEEVMAHAQAAARDADRYVRGNPWQSIGIAAGIGLLVGALLSRR